MPGQKRSKANPLLMIETRSHGRPVLKFNSPDERDAAVAAIEQARAPPAAAPAAQPAGQAAAAGGNGAANGAAPPPAGARAAALPTVGLAAAGDRGIRLSAEQRQMLLASNK